MTTSHDLPVSASADGPAWLRVARPKLRAAVRVGPALVQGVTAVHIVGDRETQSYFRVGAREAFLMACLDGSRTPEEIGIRYAERFGRRLTPEHWQQLLGSLAEKALLEPADPILLEKVRERAEQARGSEGRSALLWRLPVRGIERMIPGVARWSGWLLNTWVLIPLTVLGGAVVVLSVVNWPLLYATARGGSGSGPAWTVTVAAILLTWLVICCHEFGHGVACHRFGGRPTQIGLMWRFPLIAPYCKVDDVVTFPKRLHRMATSFAGVYVNLIALVLVAFLWQWGPATGWWHALAAALLLLGTVTVLVNLLPVVKLDGYHILEHALAMRNLQSESWRLVTTVFRGDRAALAQYTRRYMSIYAAYALFAFAVVGTALTLMLRIWFDTLAGLWGPVPAVLILIAEAIIVVLFVRWALRRRRSKTEEA